MAYIYIYIYESHSIDKMNFAKEVGNKNHGSSFLQEKELG